MTTRDKILFATILRAAGYTTIQITEATVTRGSGTRLTGTFQARASVRTSVLVKLSRELDTVELDGVPMAMVLGLDGLVTLK